MLWRVAGISIIIEYHKRKLPRAHIVVIIHPDDILNTSKNIDKLVSAKIPREPTDPDNEEITEYLIGPEQLL
jgi:hypothetical protein